MLLLKQRKRYLMLSICILHNTFRNTQILHIQLILINNNHNISMRMCAVFIREAASSFFSGTAGLLQYFAKNMALSVQKFCGEILFLSKTAFLSLRNPRGSRKKKFLFQWPGHKGLLTKRILHKIFGLKEPYFFDKYCNQLFKKQRLCKQCTLKY